MLEEKMRERFINAAFANSYNFDSLLSLKKEDVNLFLSNELDELLSYNKNHQLKMERFKRYNIKNTVPDDYNNIIVDIDNGKKVLAGIRHVGGNVKKPFIYIWPNFIINSKTEFTEIIKKTKPHFNVFKPDYMNYWLNPSSDLNNDLGKTLKPVQKLYIAELEKIKKITGLKDYDNSYLEIIQNDDYYDWYKAEYSGFHQHHPELKDWIDINSFQLMEESRRSGLLFYIIINGKTVGIIAGESRNIFGCNAVYIDEIMIANEYRGNKYSEILMSKFIEHIPSAHKYICSHIDSRNHPSIRTALKSGQRPVSVEYFIPIQNMHQEVTCR